jgi:two-component system, cell cycle response regulator DivK
MMKPTDDKTIQGNGQSPAAGEQSALEKKPEQGSTPAASETAFTEAKADASKPVETNPSESKAAETKPEDKAEESKPEIDDRPTIALSGLRPSAPPVPAPVVPTLPAAPAASEPVIPATMPAAPASTPAAPATTPAVSTSTPESPAPAPSPVSGMAMPGMSKPVAAPPTPAESAPAEAAKTDTVAKPAETTAPAAEAKPAEEANARADGDAPKRPKKVIDPTQAHVLVVEDNVPNFVLIARMLAYMGVQRCEWKTSGWQVVEFADTLPRIDLILMDIRLPYEDGFQALEKVRANARLKDTLVVAVTAEASVDQMKRAQESGFDGFLSKPLDPDRFPEQIRRVLNGESVWEIH